MLKTNKDSILVQYLLIQIQVSLLSGWEMNHSFGNLKESKPLTGIFQKAFQSWRMTTSITHDTNAKYVLGMFEIRDHEYKIDM